MKIVHIVNEFSTGVAHVITNIIMSCEQTDIESSIIYSQCSDRKLLDAFICYQVDMQREINIKKDIASLVCLKEVLNKLKPDVIHCHSAKAGVLGRISAKQLAIPACYSPHCYSFLRTDISWLKRGLFWLIEFLVAKYSKALTVASGSSEFKLAKKISNAIYLPNRVAVADEQNYVNITNHIVVSFGRITAQKGIQQYCDIVKQAPKTIKWIWIGDGEDKKLLNNLPNVIVTGWLNKNEIASYLKQAELVLFTSQWEVLPTALLEAASYAKPLVCSDIDGYRDFIQPDSNGKLFGNSQQVVKAITTLFDDAALKEYLATNAYQTVKQNFNFYDLTCQYVQCYKDLTKR